MNLTKMKKIILNTCGPLIAMVAICFITVATGCKKTDDTYKNYTNTAGTFNGNALQYLQSQPGLYDSMLLVINRLAGIADTVSKKNITLFAVNNRSFSIALDNINQARKNAIPAKPAVSFSTMDSAILDTFFCRYILKDQVSSSDIIDLTDGKLFTSTRYNYNMHLQLQRTDASGYQHGGPSTIIFSDPKNSVFVRNWIRVPTITVDIKTANARVHLLSSGHDFGFGADFVSSINSR
jgi:hypothetical protein